MIEGRKLSANGFSLNRTNAIIYFSLKAFCGRGCHSWTAFGSTARWTFLHKQILIASGVMPPV